MKMILIIIISLFCFNAIAQKPKNFNLVNDSSQSLIKFSKEEPKCVQLAVQDLINDVKKITGKTLMINTKMNKQVNVLSIKEQAQFLFDNLIYPNELMLRTCTWMENLYLANEALDLGKMAECVQYLNTAEKAISGISQLSEQYCYGKWTHWYSGERILNITGSLKKLMKLWHY